MDEKQWVCYFRVSTVRQGQSGLGLEAQQASVAQFLSRQGGGVIAEFTETESGKKASNRPMLLAALELCKKRRATLVIAKLDRLARNVFFISGLLESGVDFVAVDQPTKDKFMLHVQAAFAEEEARRISIRTKEALAAAKRRGVDIGATGRILAAKHSKDALERAKCLEPLIRTLAAEGVTTVREIAAELNARNVAAPGGRRWHVPTTFRTLSRIKSLAMN